MGDGEITIISRMHTEGDNVTYAGEIEIEPPVTIATVIQCISMAGCSRILAPSINPEFMMMVRSSDHLVLDVPSLDGYSGTFMPKVDGQKAYILCYEFGYVVTVTDPSLTTIMCVTRTEGSEVGVMADMPDIIVAEMLVDGSLVHLDTLVISGRTVLTKSGRRSLSSVAGMRPHLLVREAWTEYRT